MHNENWDDLRFVLAVAETGSILQAARMLGVNHATVLRRVSSFEERHGTVLFERSVRGYRLLSDRTHVIRAAQAVEAAMAEVGRLAGHGKLALQGTVKLTSTDTLCGVILPRFVASMRVTEPDLTISLISGNAYLDLLREQGTLSVRPTARLSDDMVGEVAGTLRFAAYAADREQRAWLALSGPLSRSVVAKWVSDNVDKDMQRAAADSFLALKEMAALGMGIAVLPSFVGDRDDRLVRLDDVMPKMTVPLWVARHMDAIETPRCEPSRRGSWRFLPKIKDFS